MLALEESVLLMEVSSSEVACILSREEGRIVLDQGGSKASSGRTKEKAKVTGCQREWPAEHRAEENAAR
jgi:hypothetical protein